METLNDETAMREAIAASARALAAGNRPFGAVLVKDGRLLHVAENDQVTSNDCTEHAEVALIRQATKLLGAGSLVDATVYASGEPCAMCAGAMFWAGVRRVIFAATTSDIGACLGGVSLPIGCADVLASASPAVTVEGPFLRDDAMQVLRAAAVL